MLAIAHKRRIKPVIKIINAIGFLLILMTASHPAFAIDKASNTPPPEIIKAQEYRAKTLDVLIDLAKNGDAEAQNTLGNKYMHGIDVEPDILISEKWFSQAAEQGHGFAQHSLALIYMHGKQQGSKIIKQDAVKAIELLTKAANSDSVVSASAMDALANVYIYGHVVEKDVDKGISILSQSADAGNGMAAFFIANMYHDGREVEKDYKTAIKWYEKALSLGYHDAQLSLNDLKGTDTPVLGKAEVINITKPIDRADFEEILGFQRYVSKEIQDCRFSKKIQATCICEVYDEILEWDELVQDFANAHPDWHGKTLKYSSKTKDNPKKSSKFGVAQTSIKSMQGHLRNLTQTTCH